MGTIKTLRQFAVKSLRRGVMASNYYLNNFRKVIWLVGEGRSGTTWVFNLLNYHKQYRYMFEPFRPDKVVQMKNYPRFHYIRPESKDENFKKFAHSVFTGQFRHDHVDAYNKSLFYKGLLIKDIFANLFVKWVDNNFPDVQKILLLRHPCAVALSKQKLKHWPWMANPTEFLSNRAMYEDFLIPFKGIIKNANTYFERQIVIWSIVHYVPLRQLSRGEIHLVFYEELCTNPEEELRRLLSYLGDNHNDKPLDPRVLEHLEIPSKLSRDFSAVIKGKNLIDGWQKELTTTQIEKAVEILNVFGLGQIYSDGLMPNRDAAERMLESF